MGDVSSTHQNDPTPDPAAQDPAEAEASQLASDLDAFQRERDELLDTTRRLQADFENYRKRVAKEAQAAQERGVIKLAEELLPALDNLDRALAEAGTAAEGGGQDDPLLEGVKLVRADLAAALARCGIESFSPEGESFDPALHEAVATAPQDGAASGTVVEVYQAGYRLGPSVIRPARVVVAA